MSPERWKEEFNIVKEEIQAELKDGETELSLRAYKMFSDLEQKIQKMAPDFVIEPSTLITIEDPMIFIPTEVLKFMKEGFLVKEVPSLDSLKIELNLLTHMEECFWPVVDAIYTRGPFTALMNGISILDIPGREASLTMTARYKAGLERCNQLYYLPKRDEIYGAQTTEDLESFHLRSFSVVIPRFAQLEAPMRKTLRQPEVSVHELAQAMKVKMKVPETSQLYFVEVNERDNPHFQVLWDQLYQDILGKLVDTKSHNFQHTKNYVNNVILLLKERLETKREEWNAQLEKNKIPKTYPNWVQVVTDIIEKLPFETPTKQEISIPTWDLSGYHFTALQSIFSGGHYGGVSDIITAALFPAEKYSAILQKQLQNVVHTLQGNLVQQIEKLKENTQNPLLLQSLDNFQHVTLLQLDTLKEDVMTDFNQQLRTSVLQFPGLYEDKELNLQWAKQTIEGTGVFYKLPSHIEPTGDVLIPGYNGKLVTYDKYVCTGEGCKWRMIGKIVENAKALYVKLRSQQERKKIMEAALTQTIFNMYLKYQQLCSSHNSLLNTLKSDMDLTEKNIKDMVEHCKVFDETPIKTVARKIFPITPRVHVKAVKVEQVTTLSTVHLLNPLLAPLQLQLRNTRGAFKSGWVYILFNETITDGKVPLYKVGHTTKEPTKRAKELCTTGVAEEFEVKYAKKSENCERVEKVIHDIFRKVRFNKRREFFLAPLEILIQVVDTVTPLVEQFFQK